jgi:hypothetical protein
MGVKTACRTSTSTGFPWESRVNPCGVFIQELAAMMPKAPIKAAGGSGVASQKCVQGRRRRQP